MPPTGGDMRDIALRIRLTRGWGRAQVARWAAAGRVSRDVVWHEGNYQSYIEDLRKRKGADADQPHRVQYKKLVRA